MSNKKSGIGKTIKRELVRAILERSQSMDVNGMAPAAVGSEAVFYDDVEQQLNIPYINRDEVPLAMDVFKPLLPEETELPVIVTIHGGGLTLGDRSISRNFGRLLAHKGYLVFSVEYRLAPRANVCEELDDVCAGLDLVGRMLVDYNVDFNRIFMAAESAGAYLAAYVAAMRGSKRLQEAIGYEPSRLRFKALGLNCGMFYTNRKDPGGWMLSEQIYGEKRADENFLQYMNPEHPEIINNLPPVFFSTSRGDFLNNYSIMMREAMKKAGRVSRLVYYPGRELSHAFFTLQTYHPSTLDCIDKMLAWFEEQAVLEIERRKPDPAVEQRRAALEAQRQDGTLNARPAWQYVKEVCAVESETAQRTALIDCTREYSYSQMFAEWERYARVFSALGMTGANGARVGIVGAIAAEPLFCFYGLNMTGAEVSMFSYPDVLPGGQWKTMVRAEHITDLILTDMMVMPALWHEIQASRKELGLRNVILLHTRLGGPCVGPAELVFDEFNYHALQRMEGTVFMDGLLRQHESTPIAYGNYEKGHIAVITHTSGSAKGTRKPLPYTDQSLNAVATEYSIQIKKFISSDRAGRPLRVAPSFDFSSFLCLGAIANSNLCAGNTVVLTFFGFLHPKFVRAVGYYQLNFLFTSGFMLDKWLENEDDEHMDFSSLEVFSCGGSYVPPEKMQQYKAFVARHGYRGTILRGYGMSECGAVQIVAPDTLSSDVLGYPEPKDCFRIQDENDRQFYRVDEGQRTGILYMTSDSHCENWLDGEKLFDFTEIDGREFVCTNDLVHVNDDGSLSYDGRADRYFVNNEGVRFDAGIVETQMSAQPGIRQCAVVPVLDKRIHDTVPVLYVAPDNKGEAAAETVRRALRQVFVENRAIQLTNLPGQFVLVDEIPLNQNGKLDIYRITRERLQGQAYNILPVREDEELRDIRIALTEQLNSITAGTLPEGMGADSAFNVFDLFNAAPAKAKPGFPPFARPKPDKAAEKEKKSMQVPPELMQTVMDMQGLMYGQKHINYYFEN